MFRIMRDVQSRRTPSEKSVNYLKKKPAPSTVPIMLGAMRGEATCTSFHVFGLVRLGVSQGYLDIPGLSQQPTQSSGCHPTAAPDHDLLYAKLQMGCQVA